MDIIYEESLSRELTVSYDNEWTDDLQSRVFGVRIPEELWKNESREIARSIKNLNGLYEANVSKMGTTEAFQTLHPYCLKEGHLLKLGIAENASGRYPYRISSIDIETISEGIAQTSLKLNPAFNNDIKTLSYIYEFTSHSRPTVSDDIDKVRLNNPACDPENQIADLHPKSLNLYEDDHILIATGNPEHALCQTI